MKPAHSQRPLDYPYTWDQFAYGQWARMHIQARVDEWLSRLFGYHMLKLGGLSCELLSENCSISHQVRVDKLHPLHTVEADSYELPFVDKAFDTCLLANQLDYTDDPHRLLREIDRVMVDDGYLIISGVNPSSLMGLGRLMPWRKNKIPWSGRMFSPLRVRDWLGVLNYEVMEISCIGLIPTSKQRMCCVWFENACTDLLPAFGSLYFIVARKRTYPLKRIKSTWSPKKQFSPVGANF